MSFTLYIPVEDVTSLEINLQCLLHKVKYI